MERDMGRTDKREIIGDEIKGVTREEGSNQTAKVLPCCACWSPERGREQHKVYTGIMIRRMVSHLTRYNYMFYHICFIFNRSRKQTSLFDGREESHDYLYITFMTNIFQHNYFRVLCCYPNIFLLRGYNNLLSNYFLVSNLQEKKKTVAQGSSTNYLRPHSYWEVGPGWGCRFWKTHSHIWGTSI